MADYYIYLSVYWKIISICIGVSAGTEGSPRNSMAVTPIVITKERKGYGLTLKPIRVYIGDSNNYRIHHIVRVSKI